MEEMQLHCGWAVLFNMNIKKAMGDLILLFGVVIEGQDKQGPPFSK